jgi:hypothetical protein
MRPALRRAVVATVRLLEAGVGLENIVKLINSSEAVVCVVYESLGDSTVSGQGCSCGSKLTQEVRRMHKAVHPNGVLCLWRCSFSSTKRK